MPLSADQKRLLTLSPPFPDRVVLELTNRCNMSCAMCPRRAMKAPLGFMDESHFKKLVDQIAEFPNTSVAPFFRGEPLIHPQCIELLRYARLKISARIMVFTNGLALDQSKADALLSIGLDHISFSLDSTDKAAYQEMRIGGDFRKVLDNVEYFLSRKKELNAALPELQVSMVKTKFNSTLVEDFKQAWKGKVDRIRIYEEHTVDGTFGKSQQSKASDDRKPCLKPFNEMVVYWNGQTALCNHDWDRQGSLGNAAGQRLVDIWNGDLYKEVRQKHLEADWKNIETCAFCDQWKSYYNEMGIVGELV